MLSSAVHRLQPSLCTWPHGVRLLASRWPLQVGGSGLPATSLLWWVRGERSFFSLFRVFLTAGRRAGFQDSGALDWAPEAQHFFYLRIFFYDEYVCYFMCYNMCHNSRAITKLLF